MVKIIPYVNYKFLKSMIKTRQVEESAIKFIELRQNATKTKDRSITIVGPMVKHGAAVYNGKRYIVIDCDEAKIGHKLGEFSLTKKTGASIHRSVGNAKRKAKARRKLTQKKVRATASMSKSKKQQQGKKFKAKMKRVKKSALKIK